MEAAPAWTNNNVIPTGHSEMSDYMKLTTLRAALATLFIAWPLADSAQTAVPPASAPVMAPVSPAAPPAAVATPAVPAPPDEVTLNLKDADINSLISTVAEVTGRNFVVDPRVKAKITVISSKPMSRQEVYGVFLSILQVHGFAAQEVGSITKIVPDVVAKQGPVVERGEDNDEIITRVIPVHNVSAVQLIPILRPLIPQQANMAAYPQSNVLVVSDRAINIDRIVDVVRRIDQTDDTQDVEIIPMKFASASEIVKILNSLKSTGAAAAGQAPITSGALSADERTNSILMSGDKNSRARMRSIIAHLDTPVAATGGTHVVFLNYANAEDLAPILQAVSSQQKQTGAVGGSEAAGAPTVGTTTGGGSAPSSSSPLNTLSKRPANRGSAPRLSTGGGDGEVGIEADPRNNALIITAPPDEFASLKAVIAKLDVRRAQVLVEAIIAEVSVNLARDLGIQLGGLDRNRTGLAGTNFGGAGNNILQIIANPTAIGQGLSLAGGYHSGSIDFAALLRALAGDTATNILSTPSLVTLDNEEAEVVVAQNVPFLTGSFTNTGAGGGDTSLNPFQTIERQDVGLTLRITPHINEGDAVRLQIETESSSLAPTPAGISASDLITNKRSVKTNVLVGDGQILILGGLIEDNFNDQVQKVPFLGDLPLVGNLFRSTHTDKTKRNLMTFIHPSILRDDPTAAAYTGSKYEFLRARQNEANIGKRGLVQDPAAELPDLDELITRPPPRNLGPIKPLQPQSGTGNEDFDSLIPSPPAKTGR